MKWISVRGMRIVFFDLTLWRFGWQRYERGLAIDLGPLSIFFCR